VDSGLSLNSGGFATSSWACNSKIDHTQPFASFQVQCDVIAFHQQVVFLYVIEGVSAQFSTQCFVGFQQQLAARATAIGMNHLLISALQIATSSGV
jgi:hypothetical protein